MRGSRGGGRGSGPPFEKKHQIIRFLSYPTPDPLKKSQSYQASIQCWAIFGTPAKRHLNGVSLAGLRGPAHSSIWTIPPSPHQLKKCQSCNHLEEEEKAVCFAIIVLHMYYYYKCSSSRCRGLICSVLLWYFLVMLTF